MSTAAADQPLGTLETIATFEGPMPTGVTVSHTGRVFVNFPKWGDDVTATVMEVRDGECVPYPDQASNDPAHNADDRALVSVQSVVVDPLDRLWALDTGSPQFQRTQVGGPKLVCIDLTTDTVVQTIVPPREVALEATYLNDIRFDLRRGEAGTAFITDSSDGGANGIIVVDLASGRSRRRLHDHPSTKPESLDTFRPVIEGRPWMVRPTDGPPRPVGLGSDGIAISSDGARLYYCPFASRRLWSVSVDALLDPSLDDDAVAATVIAEGDKGSASDGLETDDAGRLYATAYEHNAILRRLADGQWETVVHDPRLLFPDTLSVGTDRHLYVTANQLHRQAAYQGGKDLRERPYHVFRTPIDAGPVLLRPAAGS